MRTLLLALFLTLSGTTFAETSEAPAQNPPQAPQEQAVPAEIPTGEKEFVSVIDKFEKSSILEQFGEPSKRNDIKNDRTGEVIASIWHYHYLNTSATDGAYYPTTELDFVGDKVVMVVFMNHEGEEVESQPIQPPAQNDEPQLPELSPGISI